MARSRSTFGKRDRERANQLKAAEKRERRQMRSSDRAAAETAPEAPAIDQEEILNRLAALQARFESREVSLEEFEAQRDELRNQIRV